MMVILALTLTFVPSSGNSQGRRGRMYYRNFDHSQGGYGYHGGSHRDFRVFYPQPRWIFIGGGWQWMQPEPVIIYRDCGCRY